MTRMRAWLVMLLGVVIVDVLVPATPLNVPFVVHELPPSVEKSIRTLSGRLSV
jgi:hypothetical protein